MCLFHVDALRSRGSKTRKVAVGKKFADCLDLRLLHSSRPQRRLPDLLSEAGGRQIEVIGKKAPQGELDLGVKLAAAVLLN